MNCRTFRKRQAELLDARPDPATTADLLAHAAECSKCGQELSELQEMISRITPAQRLHASSQAKERIMTSIAKQDATQQAGVTRRPFYSKLLRVAALAAILLLAIVAAGRFGSRPSLASSTFAQAAESAHGVKTMHISARMRTIPNDSFDYIDLNAPLISVEMWKDFGDPSKVRIEKQGRQITADENGTTVLMCAGGLPLVYKSGGIAEQWFSTLAPILHPDTLLQHESGAAEKSDSVVSVATKTGSDGREKTILTINAEAQGDFSQSDYLKNTTIIMSDNTRIYTFDAETSRLEGLQVLVKTKTGDVLVFETTKIEYDVTLRPSLFHLNVPKNAIFGNQKEVGAKDNSWMQPDEVADQFFGALSKSDWKTTKQLGAVWIDNPECQRAYAGLKVISIGKPFQSGLCRGWFVPYEIRFRCGVVKKHNLAVRNDNPRHQWHYDGGF